MASRNHENASSCSVASSLINGRDMSSVIPGMAYHGGKQDLSRRIVSLVENLMADRKCFVDVFCGGCSVVCAMPSRYRCVANDANPYLMAMLRVLTSDVVSASSYAVFDGHSSLRGLFPMPVTRECFDRARRAISDDFARDALSEILAPAAEMLGTDKDTACNAHIGWCGFIGSMHGVFFGKFGGRTSGSSSDVTYSNAACALVTATVLKNNRVTLSCRDYSGIELHDKSLLFCDPPFDGSVCYSDTKYDKAEFIDWCRAMKGRGHSVVVHEVSMPDDFRRIATIGRLDTSVGLYVL